MFSIWSKVVPKCGTIIRLYKNIIVFETTKKSKDSKI